METEYNPFEVPDFWRRSAFTLPDAPEVTLFSNNQLELPLITHELTNDLHLPELDTFKFGQLDDLDALEPPSIHESLNDDRPSEPSTRDEDELWKLDFHHTKHTSLRTWEAFADDEHAEPRLSSISEAGPSAFDALQEDDSNVLQSAFTLKCLGLLGLGRSSALFQYKKEDNSFVATLKDIRLSGTSKATFESLVKQLSAVGTALTELRQFVDKAYTTKRPLATHIALATSIQVVVEALDQSLAEPVLAASSALQLLSYFNRPMQLLHDMRTLTESTKGVKSDVAYLSAIRSQIEQFAHASSPFYSTHAAILNRVSRPWIQEVCNMTGLSHTDMDISQRTFDAAGLIASHAAEQIVETITGLSTLKASSPNHPILVPVSWGVEKPDLDVSTADIDPDRVLEKARQYQRNLLSAIADFDKGTAKPLPTIAQGIADNLTSEQLPWHHDQSQQDYFQQVGTQFSQPPLQAADVSNLQATVSSTIHQEVNAPEDEELDIHPDTTSPIRDLQPYLDAQNRLVNGSLLRILFRTSSLRKHLNLQHSFHLFGNGLYVQRLTNALFSSSANSAERHRGVVPNSVNLGLRLDSRSSQKWPPGGSELRMGLMGVLSEAWAEKDLPGGLSFAVRELGEEEIEKVLDPHSIHALDFLRLKYDAPTPLDVVLTEEAMQKYDDCFRVLLGVLRMLHVTTLLRQAATADVLSTTPAIQAFAHDAQHTVAAISSYFLDCGIAVPWRNFNSRLDVLETELTEEDDGDEGYGSRVKLGLIGLRGLHDDMLDSIRSHLFLRSRHARLKEAVEDIFTTILHVQKMVVAGNGSSIQQDIWKERSSLEQQVKGLLMGLKELERKLSRRVGGNSQDKTDAVAAEMLGLKLAFAFDKEG